MAGDFVKWVMDLQKASQWTNEGMKVDAGQPIGEVLLAKEKKSLMRMFKFQCKRFSANDEC